MTRVSYYTNMTSDQGRRFFDGWQPGDPITHVATVAAKLDSIPATEAAFVYFQRIDEPYHQHLDPAEAPSMSVGDVVVVHDGDQEGVYVVERLGFRKLDQTIDQLDVIERTGTVAELRREREGSK